MKRGGEEVRAEKDGEKGREEGRGGEIGTGGERRGEAERWCNEERRGGGRWGEGVRGKRG